MVASGGRAARPRSRSAPGCGRSTRCPPRSAGSQVGSLALADGSIEHTSLLAELRKSAAVGEHGLLLLRALGVAPGRRGQRRGGRADGRRARRPRPARGRWSSGRGRRAGCTRSARRRRGARARRRSSARCRSASLRDIEIDGVDAGARALAPRASATRSPPRWSPSTTLGLGGRRARTGSPRASTSSPRPGRSGRACSRPSCHRSGSAYLLARRRRRPSSARARRARADVRPVGARRRRDVHVRLWATDPFTRGYVTHWWPGDVLRVGPLHGTHAPPFYVCGSDQWVAGYMEGAVRTGRAAAAAAARPAPESDAQHAQPRPAAGTASPVCPPRA